MGNIILLIITTGIGYFTGSHWFSSPIIGGGVGFLVGVFILAIWYSRNSSVIGVFDNLDFDFDD